MARKITLAIALVLVLAPSAGAVPQGSTTLIDRPSGFGALPYDGQGHTTLASRALSADGCFAVFSSESDDLLATDDNYATNVYRVNRCTPGSPAQLVNATAAGAPAEGGSYSGSATISADGRHVAFTSNSTTLGSQGTNQVFVKDMQTGAVELVSRGHGAAGAAAPSASHGVISGNGAAVAFAATGQLDAENVDGVAQKQSLYVRDLGAGSTTMVSFAANSTAGQSASWFDISYGGNHVAFVSIDKLTPDDTDSALDAYVRKAIGTSAAATRLVSFTSGQTAGADSAGDVSIAGDGGAIAFTAAGDGAFVATCPQACNAATRLDKENSGGSNTKGDQSPFFAQTSGAAPARVFWATASNLDPADSNGMRDIYSAPVGGGAVSLVSGAEATADVHTGVATANADVVLLAANWASALPGGGESSQIFVRSGGQTTNLVAAAGLAPRADEAGNAQLGRLHSVSDDGRVVVFTSNAPALGALRVPDSGRHWQVFARDVATGATTLVSVAPGGEPIPAVDPSIDAAGRRVAFASYAGGTSHVYVRDLASGTTIQVESSAEGAELPQISGDGRKVAFISDSPDLPEGSGPQHAYVADLASGAVELVDRAPNGTPANSSAHEVDLSFDGSRVAFASVASNLGAPSPGSHVYLRDVGAGTTAFASVVPEPLSNGQEGKPSLSADGTRLAFVHGAGGDLEAYVRDLSRGTSVEASAAGKVADRPSLSRDGNVVAFSQGGAVYARNLAESGQTRVDLRDGTAVPGRFGAHAVSLSGNGRCAAFASHSDDVVSPSYGPDGAHVYLRAMSGDCPGGGATAPPPGAARDTTAPVIRRARLTAKRFSLAKKKTVRAAARRKPKRGTKFVFSLSEDARTRITIARKRTRIVLTRSKTKRGTNRIAFSGKVGRRKLKPGVYKATLVATDAAGNRSKPRKLTFRVVSR
jgi:Tol biopolymer transport system component